MTKQTKGHETRKPYRKPQIEQVRLVPEEAVLGGCKTATLPSGIGNATSCTAPTTCISEWVS